MSNVIYIPYLYPFAVESGSFAIPIHHLDDAPLDVLAMQLEPDDENLKSFPPNKKYLLLRVLSKLSIPETANAPTLGQFNFCVTRGATTGLGLPPNCAMSHFWTSPVVATNYSQIITVYRLHTTESPIATPNPGLSLVT